MQLDYDLISRQAAIDAVMKYGKRIPTFAIAVKGALENLPPAQAERGKWIKDRAGYIICSECNWFAPMNEVGCIANRHMEQQESNFCPNCGAKMEGR